MTILSKLSLKSLKLNKKRSISTIIGIILSVALICAVGTLVSSFQRTLIEETINQSGYYHLQINNVTDEDIETIKNNRDVKDYFSIYENGYAVMENSQNEYKPYYKVESMSEDVFNRLKFNLIEGRFPKNSSEIIISRHIIDNANVDLKLGDKITIDVGKRESIDGFELHPSNPYNPYDESGGAINAETEEEIYSYYEGKSDEHIVDTITKTYTIVGIIERPNMDFEGYSDPGYTVITTQDTQGKEKLFISFKNPYEYKSTVVNILGASSYENLQNGSDTELKYDDFSINTELLRWEAMAFSDSTVSTLYAIAGVVIVIIIITSIFCIRNSFAIATTEKIKMYGMLASIGATKKQIKSSVITEALVLGIIGIPLGILSGIFAVFVLINLVNYILGDNMFAHLDGLIFYVSVLPIVIAFILGFVVIYLSAISSARKASKASPIESLRNSQDIKINNKKLKTPKIIQKVFKTGGVLAYKNLKRSKKKYRTTVVSLAVSIFVFITMNSFLTNAFDLSGMYYTDYNHNIELYHNIDNLTEDEVKEITSLSTVDESFLLYGDTGNFKIFDTDKINLDDGLELVDDSEYDEETNSVIPTGKGKYISVLIYGLDTNAFKEYVESINVDYEKVKDTGILVDTYEYYDENDKNTKSMRRYKYKASDTINGEYNEEPISIKVGAITDKKPYGLESTYYEGGFLIVDASVFNNLEFRLSRICINANDSEEFEKQLEEINKDIVYTNFEESVKEQKSMILVINIFLYGFITVITLIGVTNIFNTITSNMELRQKEFAMLKSIGMTRREFNNMINLETIFYSTKALIYGIIFGLIGTFAMYKAVAMKLDSGVYIPVIPIIISIIFVFILVFIIMRYSISKINKQNIIETIRKENI